MERTPRLDKKRLLTQAERVHTANSVSEIAKRLCQASGRRDEAGMLRSIRYWVNEGMLHPIGPVHPGKGRERQFDKDDILRAALIYEMTKWNLTVGTMKVLLQSLDLAAEQHALGS